MFIKKKGAINKWVESGWNKNVLDGKKIKKSISERELKELKDAFFSIKISRSTSADEISLNVTKICFEELTNILKYTFYLSLPIGIFLDLLKTEKVTPVVKTGDLTKNFNYCVQFLLSQDSQ